MRIIFITIFFITSIFLSGCGKVQPKPQEEKQKSEIENKIAKTLKANWIMTCENFFKPIYRGTDKENNQYYHFTCFNAQQYMIKIDKQKNRNSILDCKVLEKFGTDCNNNFE